MTDALVLPTRAGWPMCAVCNAPVMGLDSSDDVVAGTRTFVARCHGATEEVIVDLFDLECDRALDFRQAFLPKQAPLVAPPEAETTPPQQSLLVVPPTKLVVAKTGAQFARGSSKQDFATPPDLMAAIVARFGPMDFDIAASAENTKAPRFWSKTDDCFAQDWTQLSGNNWLNPEFDDIAPYAKRCMQARAPRWERRIFLLVPASVGSLWFANYVHQEALVLALCGRVCFDGVDPYPKDLILACYGEPPGFDVWRWQDERQGSLLLEKGG